MPRFYAKKLAIIGNTSVPVTNIKKELEKEFMIKDLETVKCIT